MNTRPLKARATALAAALSLMILSACSSGEDEPQDQGPLETVSLDADAPAAPTEDPTIAEPTQEPEPSSAPTQDPEQTSGGDDEGHGHAHGEPVQVTGDMRGPDRAEDYDPNFPMPVGMTVDEWAVEWEEGQQVVRDYMNARYSQSYRDPHPSQWIVRIKELSTPEWQRESQRLAAASNMTDRQWAEFQEDETESHVQVLEPLTLDTAFAFGKDEMWVRVPYRTWSTDRRATRDMPQGWSENEKDWGARGSTFTLMHLVHDEASDSWLVNEEGVTQMSPIDS